MSELLDPLSLCVKIHTSNYVGIPHAHMILNWVKLSPTLQMFIKNDDFGEIISDKLW